jgi:hypothetical protein
MGQLTNDLAKMVKVDGFKKKGMTWRRPVGDTIQIFDIQSSRFNTKGSESFTMNVGIFSKSVYEMTWGKVGPIYPSESDCMFRTRVSYFRNNNGDWRWDLQSETDIETVGSEIMALLIDGVIPFFESIRSEVEAYQLMKKYEHQNTKYPLYQIQLGCLAILVGDRDDGVNILRKVTKMVAWGENAEKVLARLNVNPSQDS